MCVCVSLCGMRCELCSVCVHGVCVCGEFGVCLWFVCFVCLSVCGVVYVV